MSKLLKNEISESSIKKLSLLLLKQYPSFNRASFHESLFTKDWINLALKQRIRKLSMQIDVYIDEPYCKQLAILKPVSMQFSGLFHFVFADFVEVFGKKYFVESMSALALFTQNSTAEFAIRVFLDSEPEKTKLQMLEWSQSENEHLRRLSSEGMRPRLPWAAHLPWIADNPDWIYPILDNLKADESRYVQKSVANLINDVSKNQEQWVIDLCKSWKKVQSKNTQWIIKHGLRTLLKQGNADALELIGYKSAEHVELMAFSIAQKVEIGQKLHVSFKLDSSKNLGLLRLEYAISFVRKKQKPYRKIFKISESDFTIHQREFQFTHDFKVISTRRYAPGLHDIELIVNGKSIKKAQFELIETAIN